MTRKGRTVVAAWERFAGAITAFTGSNTAFALAVGTIVVWALLGPVFDYSDSWQLVINTGTTIVTFLMVFVIQQTQNKDSLAVQLKLNEMVAAIKGASNRLINVEDLSEAELKVLQGHYRALAQLAQEEGDLLESHSVDEAKSRHEAKHGKRVSMSKP